MKRNPCYCDLWNTNPRFLEKEGVPKGYCGLCEICKAPGHTSHVPAPLPYTGSWCDEHYRLIESAFTGGFRESNEPEYMQYSFIDPETKKKVIVQAEFIGDMLFRFVAKKKRQLNRFTRPNLRAGVVIWLVPYYALDVEMNKISREFFDAQWNKAVEPEPLVRNE